MVMGISNVFQYDQAIRSAAAFDAAYGVVPSRGAVSGIGSALPPYTSLELITTRFLIDPRRAASSTFTVESTLFSITDAGWVNDAGTYASAARCIHVSAGQSDRTLCAEPPARSTGTSVSRSSPMWPAR